MLHPRQETAIELSRAMAALALAAFAGIIFMTVEVLPGDPRLFFSLLLLTAPFAYGTAAAFVLPILAVWPASRRPPYPVAATWGAAAGGGMLVVIGVLGVSLGASQDPLGDLLLLNPYALVWTQLVPGAVSGVVYAWFVRRGPTTQRTLNLVLIVTVAFLLPWLLWMSLRPGN